MPKRLLKRQKRRKNKIHICLLFDERRSLIMKNETVKTGMKIGATVGGLIFLVAGIVPGFYFGSFGTLILLQKVMGGTVEPSLFVRAAIVMGIGVGIACAATVSIVVGGLLGTLMGSIVAAPAAMRAKKEAAAMA
jgi:hypothetical protein